MTDSWRLGAEIYYKVAEKGMTVDVFPHRLQPFSLVRVRCGFCRTLPRFAEELSLSSLF
jgi:hypothetical protein